MTKNNNKINDKQVIKYKSRYSFIESPDVL